MEISFHRVGVSFTQAPGADPTVQEQGSEKSNQNAHSVTFANTEWTSEIPLEIELNAQVPFDPNDHRVATVRIIHVIRVHLNEFQERYFNRLLEIAFDISR